MKLDTQMFIYSSFMQFFGGLSLMFFIFIPVCIFILTISPYISVKTFILPAIIGAVGFIFSKKMCDETFQREIDVLKRRKSIKIGD